ncbi:MAG: L-arabinose transport system permease protein AraQ [Anaerolineales bacterium]|nr:L-arabinose transport system permease protein AraQ [Anaerolineales bacterium]
MSISRLVGLGARKIIEYAIYLAILLIFVIPFAWMILGSLRNETEIFANLYPFTWHTIVPIEWTLKNYLDIFGLSPEGQSYGLNFQRFLFNSFLVSAAVVCSSLVVNTMGAYFFARLDFPYKNVLLVFVIATMLVPFQVTMVPLYIVVSSLNLEDTYWALILPWYASPFVIFALIQFFKEIPKELDEAAIIDGASYWGVLRHVIVPNAIPGIITLALLEFQFIWNLFYWPLIAISNNNLQMIQVAISQQTTQTQVYWGRTFAGATLASLPVIILFLALQRYYVQGIALSGLKG